MSKSIGLTALSLLLVAACGRSSSSSRDGGGGQGVGTDGGAGATGGGDAGQSGGGQSGSSAAAGTTGGGGTTGAGGASGGAAGTTGVGGAAGVVGAAGTTGAAGSIGALSGCFPAMMQATGSFTGACATTCGNGTIDSCTYTTLCPGSAGHVCPMATFTESCDGAALGNNSCASLGFSGGTLRCGSWCGLDTRACDACEYATSIVGCLSAVPEVSDPTALALAATDTEIAIAWLDGESDAARTGLRFARFRPDLSRISQSECFGPAAATQASLAATPSGWLLAATAADGVHVFALSPAGAPSGPERLIAGAKDPLLAGRPTAGPLLSWTAGGKTFVKLLLADGSDETTAVSIFPYAIDSSAAVFTGDGFLLASRLAQIVTTRIGTDGQLAGQTTIPSALNASTPNGYAPGLAWNGTSAAVAYSVGQVATAGPSSVAWLRVDRSGAAMGVPTMLAAFPTQVTSTPIDGTPIAAVGDKMYVLARPASALQFAKVDVAGATVAIPSGLSHDPSGVRSYRIAKRGPDVIAAWTTYGFRDAGRFPGRIGLARLAP
jgi:hypothetical protein